MLRCSDSGRTRSPSSSAIVLRYSRQSIVRSIGKPIAPCSGPTSRSRPPESGCGSLESLPLKDA
jgi:hypothetical protein